MLVGCARHAPLPAINASWDPACFRFRRFSDQELPSVDRARRCRSLSPYQFKRRLTDPLLHPSKLDLPPPRVTLRSDGYCNDYLPGGLTRVRLLYVIQAIIANGMYVILDYHPSSGARLRTANQRG